MREPQYVALNERSACGWSPGGKLTSVRRSGIVSGGNYSFCEEDEWCVLQSGVYVACWSGRLSGHSGPEGGWRGESFEEHLAADASTFPLSPNLLQPSGLRPLLHGSHAFFILRVETGLNEARWRAGKDYQSVLQGWCLYCYWLKTH